MNTAAFPMPGALRWRMMVPLIDGDGSCSLVYDLERAAVLEVPEELQFHVAPALDNGDLDDELLTWLVNEDLLTAEGWAGWSGDAAAGASWWSPGAVWRSTDELHARLGPIADAEVEAALEAVFKQGAGVSRLHLSLDWDGAFPGSHRIERIVVEAGRLAALTGQEIAFTLNLDVRQVTPIVATCVEDYPVHLRVRCGDFPSRESAAAEKRAWASATSSLLRLAGLADRVTVACTLSGGARLLDFWSWAKRAGFRHLDAVRLEGDPARNDRDYRNDLVAISQEMSSELEARRTPIGYLPLTRIVRRLMDSEPLARFREGAAGPGIGVGDGLHSGLEGLPLDPWAGYEEEEGTQDGPSAGGAFPCLGCWARYICNHSSLLASAFEEEDPREPSRRSCPVWLAEAEVALRFYHRLAQCDPIEVLRFLGSSARMATEPLGWREGLGTSKLPC